MDVTSAKTIAQQAEELLAKGATYIRFSCKEMEKRYKLYRQQAYTDLIYRLFKTVLLVAIGMLIYISLVWGHTFFTEDRNAWLACIFGILVPLVVGIYFARFIKTERNQQIYTAIFAIIILSFAITGPFLVNNLELRQEQIYAAMIIMWLCGAFVPFRISFAAITYISALIINLLIIFQFNLDFNVRNYVFVSMSVFSFLLSIAQDSTQRRAFLQHVILQAGQQELEVLNAQLAHEASIDPLTGLANRRQFNQQLQREWKRLARNQQPISIIIFDIDDFKKYNDRYGHPQGDVCLITLADVLRETVVRPSDLVSRYGGEEFIVLLSETSVSGAVFVAQRIREAIEQQAIPHQNNKDEASYVTVSLGITEGSPQEKGDPNQLIEQADKALYHAKQRGKNCIVSIENSRFSMH